MKPACSARLRRGRVDDRPDPRDAVGGEPALPGVLAHRLLVRREVHAVDLVVGDVALDPLDLRPHPPQDAAGLLRDGLELLGGQLPGAGDLSLDDELGHGGTFLSCGSLPDTPGPAGGTSNPGAARRRRGPGRRPARRLLPYLTRSHS